jgi:hypothetical protein
MHLFLSLSEIPSLDRPTSMTTQLDMRTGEAPTPFFAVFLNLLDRATY